MIVCDLTSNLNPPSRYLFEFQPAMKTNLLYCESVAHLLFIEKNTKTNQSIDVYVTNRVSIPYPANTLHHLAVSRSLKLHIDRYLHCDYAYLF